MKFIKGIMIGTIVATGVAMMYTETSNASKRKMMKKGKQFIKKMGIM